jgi:hypothetical protein
MPGMVELGEDIFLKPVRRGNPQVLGACPTWWPSRAPPRSWACSKKRAWRVCAASRWRKKRLHENRFRPVQRLSSWGTSDMGTDKLWLARGSPHAAPKTMAVHRTAFLRLDLAHAQQFFQFGNCKFRNNFRREHMSIEMIEVEEFNSWAPRSR